MDDGFLSMPVLQGSPSGEEERVLIDLEDPSYLEPILKDVKTEPQETPVPDTAEEESDAEEAEEQQLRRRDSKQLKEKLTGAMRSLLWARTAIFGAMTEDAITGPETIKLHRIQGALNVQLQGIQSLLLGMRKRKVRAHFSCFTGARMIQRSNYSENIFCKHFLI